jgi:hypothetical protein
MFSTIGNELIFVCSISCTYSTHWIVVSWAGKRQRYPSSSGRTGSRAQCDRLGKKEMGNWLPNMEASYV